MKPPEGLAVVLLAPVPTPVALGKRTLCPSVALARRSLEEFKGLLEVRIAAQPVLVAHAHLLLRVGVPLLGARVEPM